MPAPAPLVFILIAVVWLLLIVLCVGLCHAAARGDRMIRDARRAGDERR